jgi:glucokinase
MANSIGIDVGGTKILGIVLDDKGSILLEERVPTPAGFDAQIAAMVGVAAKLHSQKGAKYLGAGMPGLMNLEGALTVAPNLPGVDGTKEVIGVSIADRMRESLKQFDFILVGNDANCSAWGERTYGAGKGFDDVLVIQMGTGTGGGIICNGNLLRGAHGFAAELGHMVLEQGGHKCGCGQLGCWETLASGTALKRYANDAISENPDGLIAKLASADEHGPRGENIVEAALQEDEQALAILKVFSYWLGVGICNLCFILDPGKVVVASSVVEQAGEQVLPIVRDVYNSAPFNRVRPIEIVAATLGNHAGAVGAADLARVMATRQ